jgi:6-phosphogluconolactonase (cycloisomerase 2 family)
LRRLFRTGLRAAAAGAVVCAFGGAAIAAAGPAGAAVEPSGHHDFDVHGVVFVQNDNLAGNQVIAYDRAPDGQLDQAGTYSTGGLGGQLVGSVVDHLASEGALAYSPLSDDLYAVNAGSDTVSVFAVFGDRLFLTEVVPSGGTFPVSVAVRGDLVYVVNALNGGSLQGYYAGFGRLVPIPGSNRSLGLDPTATPQFVNTPGQVAFSPDGSQLIVTTKANGNDIDVFQVSRDGAPSAAPVVNSEPGTVPFGIAFDASGNLVIAEAGTDALATFSLGHDGTVTPIAQVANGQAATCWVAAAGPYFYTSNAGSATLSGYSQAGQGQLSLLGETSTDGGTVDAAVSPRGGDLYVQTGAAGVLDEFQIARNGSLTEIGSVTVPDAVGGEGIVAL